VIDRVDGVGRIPASWMDSRWRAEAAGSLGLDADEPHGRELVRGDASQPITVVLGDTNRLVTQTMTALLDAQPDLRVVRSRTDIDGVLEAVEAVQPDVTLLGMELLLEDIQRCAAIFREGESRSKLIVMSSNEDEHVVEASVLAGAAGYVHGGLPIDEIVSAVRRVKSGDVLFEPQMLVGLLQRPARSLDLSDAGTAGMPGPREIEVLQALARGLSTHQIAEHLEISTHTVRSHVRNVMKKLHARTKLDAVMIALREGRISLDR
jgi:DNA-binding NarL/FixJ family response regulator